MAPLPGNQHDERERREQPHRQEQRCACAAFGRATGGGARGGSGGSRQDYVRSEVEVLGCGVLQGVPGAELAVQCGTVGVPIDRVGNVTDRGGAKGEHTANGVIGMKTKASVVPKEVEPLDKWVPLGCPAVSESMFTLTFTVPLGAYIHRATPVIEPVLPTWKVWANAPTVPARMVSDVSFF